MFRLSVVSSVHRAGHRRRVALGAAVVVRVVGGEAGWVLAVSAWLDQ